jgi:hypothetical protein
VEYSFQESEKLLGYGKTLGEGDVERGRLGVWGDLERGRYGERRKKWCKLINIL